MKPSGNIHAPSPEIQAQFVSLEWRGKRWAYKGKTFIKAKYRDPDLHRTFGTLFYSFEDNFAWIAKFEINTKAEFKTQTTT